MLNFIFAILGLSGWKNYSLIGIILLIILWLSWQLLSKLYLRYYQRILSKRLAPYYDIDEIKRYTEFYVPTQFQNVPPSIKDEPSQSITAKERIIPYFIKRNLKVGGSQTKNYIILADSGMGKTAFMINLYLRYITQWFVKKKKLRMYPLGLAGIEEEFANVDEDERKETILLLDAFDEDNKAVKNYEKRLDEILSKVTHYYKVIITCRTQFFPSVKEEPYEMRIPKYNSSGYYVFEKMYLSPFDNTDIRRYLQKKYGWLRFWNLGKKKKAESIIKKSPNLMVRPMLLSYIDDLLESTRSYLYTYQIYEVLIEKWIQREADRRHNDKEGFKKELYKFSREIALDIYLNRERRGELIIYADEIEPFAKSHKINLEDMEMKSRSLLNRKANEGNQMGQYKFSHKSILEYFLALEAYNNKEFEKQLNFDGMEQAKKFFRELYYEGVTLPFFNNAEILKGSFKTEKPNKVNTIDKIKDKDLENLVYLELKRNKLSDIRVMAELKSLTNLDLSFNAIEDISALEDLNQIKILHLNANQISNIDVIANLKSLKILHLNANKIVEVNSLKKLKNLISLDLRENKVTDISALKNLKNLKNLDLSYNQIDDLSALRDLKTLVSIDLSSNQVSDLTPLKDLKNLTDLELSSNKITDVSPLKDLKNLEVLYLRFNKIDEKSLIELKKTLPKCRIEV